MAQLTLRKCELADELERCRIELENTSVFAWEQLDTVIKGRLEQLKI